MADSTQLLDCINPLLQLYMLLSPITSLQFRSTANRNCKTKKLSDQDLLIPHEYLNKWFSVNCIKTISSLQDPLNDSMTELAKYFRNVLLLHTSITNIKRTGILESITLDHVDKAKRMKDGGLCLVVADGKTFRFSGAANVLFSVEETKALNNYIHFVRPVFKPDNKQLFCRTEGNWASATYICRFAQAA